MGRRRMKTNGDEKETRLAETTATYALGVFCQLVRKMDKQKLTQSQQAGFIYLILCTVSGVAAGLQNTG